MLKRLALLMIIIVASVSLSACESAEARAQKHYEKGLSLLAEGDTDRALLEFRNVFKLDEKHKGARLAYARTEEKRGNISSAFGQYLRLVEQYPDNLEGQRALARLAAGLNDWETVAQHVSVAKKLAPEDPVVQSLQAGLDYRNALRAGNSETADLAVRVSENLLQEHPDLPVSRKVVINDLLRRQDWQGALAELDAALQQFPDQLMFYRIRLAVLEKLGREDDVVAQLRDMVERFPDAGIHRTLVKRYIAQGRLEDAETYLRERVAQKTDTPDARLELLSFLKKYVGADAALAEVDRILADTTDHPALFRSVRATLDFEAGNRDAAIAEIETILKDAEASEETDRIRISLAKMLIVTGNSVGARAQIEKVLEHDATQVTALKLKAGWLIDDDRPGDALVELRVALDQAPKDAETMSLMAKAYERAGNRDLMGEMLALAATASKGGDIKATLRYARFLMQEDKLLSAEDTLKEALRVQNTNPDLLFSLGKVYVRMKDWPRTQGVIDALQRIDADRARRAANELTAQKLAGQKNAKALETFLSGLAEGKSGLQAAASIIRLRLAQKDVQGAREYVEKLIREDPENPSLRFIQAGVLVAEDRGDEAVAILRDLVSKYPKGERVWLALYNLYRSRGENDEASKLLTEALAALPQSANLKWAQAGEAERRGDIPQAIAIYEDLYARNSNSQVIANNLASMISSYQEDDESLQRAYNIARRLRGTKVPAFQDTYGWIAQRLGNYAEALEYLEPAAAAIQNDPSVQYHLAETYAALGRDADALAQFQKVVALVKESGANLPFLDRTNEEISRLSPDGN